MKKPISFFEFETKEFQNPDLRTLSAGFIDSFERYLDSSFVDSPLKVNRRNIAAKNLVGSISFRNHQFEVLPKLLAGGHDSPVLLYKNLLAMLNLSKHLEIKTTDILSLSKSQNSLLEVFIGIYADILINEITLRPIRRYESQSENLNTIRGQILFPEHIKHNFVNQQKIYCLFDSLTENNAINQLFKFVTNLLLKITQDEHNYFKLGKIKHLYSDVQDHPFTFSSANKLKLERNTLGYSVPFNIAKMILDGYNFEPRFGAEIGIGILFDMNKLFEEYIFEVLKNYSRSQNFKVWTQKQSSISVGYRDLRVNEYVDSSVFGTRSDIVIELENNDIIVIDTKYKVLDLDRSKTFGVTNSDVFQILAYAGILGRTGRKVLPVLLYPQPNNDQEYSVSRIFQTSEIGNRPFVIMTTSLFSELWKPSVVRDLAKSIIDRSIAFFATDFWE